MDFSSVMAAVASLKTAQELASAAIGIRDANAQALAISKINEQLLSAQQGLLAHNAMLLQLQNEHFEATKELRELKEAVSEKNRYSLFELSEGNYVYRVNVAPELSGAGNPGPAEPEHFLCQPCFDNGHKSVLQRTYTMYSVMAHCSLCDTSYDTGIRQDIGPLRY